MAKTVMLGVWVTQEIREHVKMIASIKGVSTGEYVRQLIDQDLDKRTIFTDQLKTQLAE